MNKLSRRSKRNRSGVDPRLIEIDDLALIISPIDFGIPNTGGRRTAKFQQSLYMDGLSQCDGYNDVSKHQLGLALDFFAFVDGKASWQEEHLAIVGASHLQAASLLGYKLTWGGLWVKWKDYPHVQLED